MMGFAYLVHLTMARKKERNKKNFPFSFSQGERSVEQHIGTAVLYCIDLSIGSTSWFPTTTIRIALVILDSRRHLSHFNDPASRRRYMTRRNIILIIIVMFLIYMCLRCFISRAIFDCCCFAGISSRTAAAAGIESSPPASLSVLPTTSH